MNLLIWIGFGVLFTILVLADLGLFSKKNQIIGVKSALRRTAVWIGVALAFVPVVFYLYENHIGGLGVAVGEKSATSGREAAITYLTGWVVEYALSVDNLFVIAVIFTTMKIPAGSQHRVLFWGILGAAVMRAILIVAGVELVQKYEWIMYVFGVLLLWASYKMLRGDADGPEDTIPAEVSEDLGGTPGPAATAVASERSWIVRLASKIYPISDRLDGEKFTIMENGRRALTPLAVALLMIEAADLGFAVDSIPAVVAITKDSFLAITSNLFAILGLRSLYFALSAAMDAFRYLKYSLAAILAFISVKMLLHSYYKIDVNLSLGIVIGLLLLGVAASLIFKPKPKIAA
jgi:tellurite resistance protein TerC